MGFLKEALLSALDRSGFSRSSRAEGNVGDTRRGTVSGAGSPLTSAGTLYEYVPSSTCEKYSSGKRWRSVHNTGLFIVTYRDVTWS